MKLQHKIFFIVGIISSILISCNNEFEPQHKSNPNILETSLLPLTFTFGDSVYINAKVEDKETNLTMLLYEISDSHKVISQGQIPLNSDYSEVNHAVKVPLLRGQEDNAELSLKVTAFNVLKGLSTKEVTGIIGKRPVYDKLYFVTDEGAVATLYRKEGSKDLFISDEQTFNSSISYKIVEKINDDKSIDHSGHLYGNKDGHISMIDEKGESAFVFAPNSDYTKIISFDVNTFNVDVVGDKLDENSIALTNFDNMSISSESFRTMNLYLEKDKVYSLFGELADKNNIYNTDFFERVEDNKVKFLRDSEEYTLYYNPVRKNIIVGVNNPSYPEFLLACGFGLGYPTNVSSSDIAKFYPNKQRTHSDWGFDNILKYTLLPRIADGIYQGTFYTPADNDKYAGFKLFENTGWGNEKKASMFTFTGEPIIKGIDNWEIPNGGSDPVIEPANYRFTVNLKDNTVNIEKTNIK